MEGAVHWATWALQWGFIKSDDLEVRSSGAGKTSSSSQPLLSALRDFFRVIPEVSGPPSPSGACGILAGCDADVFHLSARLFDLLRLVRCKIFQNLFGSPSLYNFSWDYFCLLPDMIVHL